MGNRHGNDAEPSADTTGSIRSRSKGKRSLAGKSIGGIAILALVGLYSVARPMVNERMGWDLPELRRSGNGQVSVVDEKNKSTSSTSTRTADAKPGDSAKARGPLADRMRPSGSSASKSSSNSNSSANSESTASQDGDLLYGILKEVGSRRYVSPAGLLYTPGSAEGHRLEHLRRHTEDQPSRPGSHGVFDGEMAGALKTIDRAYDRAKKGQKTTKKVDDGRTIYTVDMGGRVGFVGGRDGGRRRNPMARRVQIVLEGTRVITAYPK